MSVQVDLGELNPVGGGDPLPLLKPYLLIGRRPQCDIVLAFPNVSSQHCSLELKNGFWFVLDLNSRNGIKVNGVRCDSNWLQPGDELSVAKHTFRIQYQPSADAPPPAEIEEDPLDLGLLEKLGMMRRKPVRKRDLPRSAKPVDDSKFSPEENDVTEFLQDGE
jgi:hypothetical protein